jgi:DNA-binding transcriptional LysR family regulator
MDMAAGNTSLEITADFHCQDLIAQTLDKIEFTLLAKYPYYVAMSPTHPLAKLQHISIKTLADYPLLIYDVNNMNSTHAFQQYSDIKISLSSNNINIIEERLRNTNSIVYSFPCYIKHGVLNNFVHIPVSDRGFCLHTYAVINKNAPKHHQLISKEFLRIFSQYL